MRAQNSDRSLLFMREEKMSKRSLTLFSVKDVPIVKNRNLLRIVMKISRCPG